MAKALENQQWNTLIEVIQRSYQIKKHVDFFRWQQDDVTRVFPHDVLIAVWGDFNKGLLNYDVSSNIPGVRTHSLRESSTQADQLMGDLYQRWLANNERWYRINNFSMANDGDDLPDFFNHQLSEIHSLLVFGVRDIRGNNDCLYVFMHKDAEFPITSSVLGMLMPHLDAALRRIESLEVEGDEDDLSDYPVQGLSDREHEIIHWVRMGKTNFEISMILSISPNTVKNHLKRIFSKLDVTCRAQAVATYVPPKLN
ncbi:MAG TPA: LuxR C-terminal-related transcriptional regulator [Methylotenera sp.]|nr:LuxR C-terminal-related transcriptional regulator [Methylotenera sp.]HPH06332.1 LuxR C-terminal-related transcriptional regulator [Methylotenera sp.]HPN00849.1 LuxR C-terminal-related transcriptional regulator [Methylotenera sp.]